MTIEKTFLIMHILTGSIALISGGVAALSRKGAKRHIETGRVFAYSMLATGISALVLSSMRPNPFLFGIGIFTIYLVVSGWVPVKHISFASKLKIIKATGIFGILAAAYMIIQALLIGKTSVLILYSVFGTILLALSLADTFKPLLPAGLIGRHGGRMGGASIAAFTAFLVVNNTFLPPLVAWLLPTAIGTPLLIIVLRRRDKQNARK